MDTAHTIKLLTALSNGADPFTGAAFPADSPYQHPEVVRALFQAVRQLEAAAATPAGRPARSSTTTANAARPSNAGKPWNKDEDEALLGAYDAGATIDELARSHGRSRLGVEARLAKFDRVPMPERVRSRQDKTDAQSLGDTLQVRQPLQAAYQACA